MSGNAITCKGQVTVPKAIRQARGLRTGSKVGFRAAGDDAEIFLPSTPVDFPPSDLGLVRGKRPIAQADFDVVEVLAILATPLGALTYASNPMAGAR